MSKKAQEHRGFNLGDADRVLELEEAGIDVHMKGVDRKPLFYQNGKGAKPVTWKIAGRYSDRFRRAEEEANRIRAEKGGDPFDRAVQLEDQIERASRMVISWEGVVEGDGTPVRCEAARVRAILERYPWTLPQVVEGMGNHAGFLANASTA
jgi:hypothetical protein